MGRTVLPFSRVLEQEVQEWKKFRRGLRKEDQQFLDRLFEHLIDLRGDLPLRGVVPQPIGGYLDLLWTSQAVSAFPWDSTPRPYASRYATSRSAVAFRPSLWVRSCA